MSRWLTTPLLLALSASSAPLYASDAVQRPAFGDADDLSVVLTGQRLYRNYCAQCHGRTLQGQALWRLDDEYAHQRAPALDGTGHAWQHSDAALYRRIRDGIWLDDVPLTTNAMPRFDKILSDGETWAVIAFVKSRWGTGLRAAQSTLNPNQLGMPRDAATTDWTLPPTCTSTQQRWRTRSPEDGTSPP
jgi:mono/diheme cytochrome c family protein